MCFQAFCLEIICSDPQGVLQVFPIREFSTKNAEHFVFLSFKPQPFLSFHASWYLHVLLVEAGVSDAVLISLSSDDCFPPKKEYSGPCTGFRFNILWLMF